MALQDIKQLSIRDYLAKMGIKPQSERGNRGMFLSPFRQESNASFSVNYDENVWYDHGIGKGGSIIDLVMMIENCDFKTAVGKLETNSEISVIPYAPKSTAKQNSSIQVTGVSPIQSRALIEYLAGRGIPLSIAQQECREIRYRIGDNEREFYAIGFLNDAGGWELRNRHYKYATTPKTITTIKRPHYRGLVFEGFMDYLSYIRMQRGDRIPDNIIVLNSTANAPKALDFIRSLDTVHAFLDHDKAGRKALSELKKGHPNVIDQSYFYDGANDLNEHLQKIKNEPDFLELERSHKSAVCNKIPAKEKRTVSQSPPKRGKGIG